ncbi:MAG: hypothetical protein OXR66_05170 [Candidatus Woesearchaeota archaeon]|nr:hypothetical protein [Candidatus Woesearchaeota archaeon]
MLTRDSRYAGAVRVVAIDRARQTIEVLANTGVLAEGELPPAVTSLGMGVPAVRESSAYALGGTQAQISEGIEHLFKQQYDAVFDRALERFRRAPQSEAAFDARFQLDVGHAYIAALQDPTALGLDVFPDTADEAVWKTTIEERLAAKESVLQREVVGYLEEAIPQLAAQPLDESSAMHRHTLHLANSFKLPDALAAIANDIRGRRQVSGQQNRLYDLLRKRSYVSVLKQNTQGDFGSALGCLAMGGAGLGFLASTYEPVSRWLHETTGLPETPLYAPTTLIGVVAGAALAAIATYSLATLGNILDVRSQRTTAQNMRTALCNALEKEHHYSDVHIVRTITKGVQAYFDNHPDEYVPAQAIEEHVFPDKQELPDRDRRDVLKRAVAAVAQEKHIELSGDLGAYRFNKDVPMPRAA